MKAFLEKKYVNTGFALAIIILISVSILTYLNTSNYLKEQDYVKETLTTIQTSEALLSRLTQAETSRRGYLIANQQTFLDDFKIANVEADTMYKKLKTLTSNDVSEIAIMDSLSLLIHNRRDIMKESLDLQEQKERNMTAQAEFTNRGKEIQDRIKSLITKIQDKERSDLADRYSESDVNAKYTLVNLVIGNIIAFILVIIGVILLNRNISQRKKSEQQLEENRNWLYTTLTSIGDAVIVTDKTGDITFLNPVAESLTGFSYGEAEGMYIEQVFNVVNEDTRNKVENPVLKVFKTGNIVALANHSVLITKNLKEIPIDDSAAPIKNNEGSIIGVVLVFRDVSMRRKAEKELHNSRKFIQKIADSIPNILYVYELSGPRMTYANYKIADLLGYSSDDVKKMGEEFFIKYIHPDDFSRLTRLYQKYAFAKDNEVLDYEFRVKNSAGEWLWFHSYDVVFSRNSEGAAIEMLGTALDVTEQKMLEVELKKYSGHLEELVQMRTRELQVTNNRLKEEIATRVNAQKDIAEAEEKFRSVVENSLVGIYILQESKIVYINPKMQEIFDLPVNFIASDTNILDFVMNEDKSIVEKNFWKAQDKEGESIQYVFRNQTNKSEIKYIEVKSGSKMEYNGKEAIIGTLQDVTDRVRAEQALMRQEEYLRTIIDINPSLIFAKDWDGRFTLVNKEVANIYNTTVDELIGKTDADFNTNMEEVKRFLSDDRQVISSQISKQVGEETVTNPATNETRWFQTIKVPFKSVDGSNQVLGVSTDITARKLSDELTKKSLREKEMLLKEIHHRVKNNLQIIVSLLKLQSKYIHDKRDFDIFQKSRARVETMSLIHEKLYKSADISSIDLGVYTTDLANHLLKAYNVNHEHIELVINSDEVNLGIDSAIPCGLIINELIINILKYAFPEHEQGRIEITIKKAGEYINLIVKDNGIGLPENFDSKNSESLGLQLVHTLIKQLDGTLIVSSDNGAKFSFVFKEIKYKDRI